MPDFEVTVTSTKSIVAGEQRTTIKSVVLENYQRNTAIPKGIDEIMAWAAEESTPDNIPIPADAIKYWTQARNNGNLQMYEIQTQLEQWGISFGIKELGDAVPVRAQKVTRNGTAPAKPQAPQRIDLRGILTQQLELLQARQKDLIAERKALQAEYEENQNAIGDITAYLMIDKSKKRKRKADAET
jgi:hypothetical protein